MKDFIAYLVIMGIIFLLMSVLMPREKSATNPHCEGLEVSQEINGKIIIDKEASERRYEECARLDFGK